MTAFLAGALFGGLFAGAVFALFVTRVQRPRKLEQWEDPFFEPEPVAQPINRKLIRERTFQ